MAYTDIVTKHISTPDDSYLQGVQLVASLSLATIGSSVSYLVRPLVTLWGCPIDVCKRIIRTSKWTMTSLMSPWSWANESFKDKLCYVAKLVVYLYSCPVVTITTMRNGRHQSWFTKCFTFSPTLIAKPSVHSKDVAVFVGKVIWVIRYWFHMASNKNAPSIVGLPGHLWCTATIPEALFLSSFGNRVSTYNLVN